jgi:hypothetical protein
MLNCQLSKKLQPVNFKFQLLDFANLGYTLQLW